MFEIGDRIYEIADTSWTGTIINLTPIQSGIGGEYRCQVEWDKAIDEYSDDRTSWENADDLDFLGYEKIVMDGGLGRTFIEKISVDTPQE